MRSLSPNPTTNMDDAQRKRRQTPRTRTGCLPCRLRRKKCEEQKPICIGCQRNHLLCSWPATESSDLATTAKEKVTDLALSQSARHWMKELASGRGVSSQVISKTRDCEESSDERKEGETFEKDPCDSRKSRGALSDNIDFTRILPLIRCRVTSSASATLLSHYINSTALRISGRIHPKNPYLTEILPVALADDGVLHTILALSGAHLTYRSSEFDYHSRSHYAVAVRSTKHQLRKWGELDVKEAMVLLTAILFLCLHEVVDGNIQGASFYHLRASRHLLLHLRSKSQTSHLLDFLIEQYAFLAITSTVCLDFDSNSPSLSVDRQLPLDSLLSDLDKLNRGSNIYGFMFGGAHQLFELVPPITQSALNILGEAKIYDREQLLSHYELKILSWQFKADKEDTLETDSSNENYDISHYQTAGRIYQCALLIFLFCAFHGPSAPSQSLIDKINPCLESFILHMQRLPIDCPSVTTMMWPILVAGSCMRTSEHRNIIRGFFEEIKLEMWNCKTPLELLEFVWEDQNYGLYGLELAMKKRRYNICIG